VPGGAKSHAGRASDSHTARTGEACLGDSCVDVFLGSRSRSDTRVPAAVSGRVWRPGYAFPSSHGAEFPAGISFRSLLVVVERSAVYAARNVSFVHLS